MEEKCVSCIAAEKSLVGPDLLSSTSQTIQTQDNSFASQWSSLKTRRIVTQVVGSDVNKDWTCNDKDLTHKDQDKDLNLVLKESLMARTRTSLRPTVTASCSYTYNSYQATTMNNQYNACCMLRLVKDWTGKDKDQCLQGPGQGQTCKDKDLNLVLKDKD